MFSLFQVIILKTGIQIVLCHRHDDVNVSLYVCNFFWKRFNSLESNSIVHLQILALKLILISHTAMKFWKVMMLSQALKWILID